MMRFLSSFIFIFLSFQAVADEVDDFQNPARPLKDSSQAINAFIQANLKSIEKELKPLTCPNRSAAIEILRFNLDRNFTKIGRALLMRMSADPEEQKALDQIDMYKIPRAKSIYRDYSRTLIANPAARVHVNGVTFGIDKIDHVFGNGGLLWLQTLSEDVRKLTPSEKMKLVLDLNNRQEHNWWGLGGAGVKSYGDLAANWSGYQFWNELLDSSNPYFKCVGGKYQLSRKFDIKKMSNASWDESVNCSSYVSAEDKEMVMARLKEIKKSCPQNIDSCKNITKIYAHEPVVLESIISPKCLDPKSNFNQIESNVLDWNMNIKSISGLSWDVIKNHILPVDRSRKGTQ